MGILCLVCAILICMTFFRTVTLQYKDPWQFYETDFVSMSEVFPAIISFLVDIFTAFFFGGGDHIKPHFVSVFITFPSLLDKFCFL